MLRAGVDDIAHHGRELPLPQPGVHGQAHGEVGDLAAFDGPVGGFGVRQVGGDELIRVVDLPGAAADETDVVREAAVQLAGEFFTDRPVGAQNRVHGRYHSLVSAWTPGRRSRIFRPVGTRPAAGGARASGHRAPTHPALSSDRHLSHHRTSKCLRCSHLGVHLTELRCRPCAPRSAAHPSLPRGSPPARRRGATGGSPGRAARALLVAVIIGALVAERGQPRRPPRGRGSGGTGLLHGEPDDRHVLPHRAACLLDGDPRARQRRTGGTRRRLRRAHASRRRARGESA